MKRRSLRAAVDAMCRSCIYDPGARGNWREQVQACSSANCPLHPSRPISSASARDRTSVALDMTTAPTSRVHVSKIGLLGPALSVSNGGSA
jgi:hypothetical protein